MRYVIAGKSESFWVYTKEKKFSPGVQVKNARTKKIFSEITENDIIVLLYGWWAKEWAKEAIKEVMRTYPSISMECLDGPFGEKERKDLKSETISNRFDLLDL